MFEEDTTTPRSRKHGAPGLTGAILLISVGVIALLNNLNILSVDLLSLLRFWPVILIFIGLDIILGRHSALGSLVVAAIAVAVIGGIVWMVGVTGQWAIKPGETITQDISQELDDVQDLKLNLDVGIMKTRLESLDSIDYAVQGTHRTNSDSLMLDVDYRKQDDTGILTIKQTGQKQNISFQSETINDLALRLNGKIPVEIAVNAGVGESVLDLTDINLRSLKINAGVGSLTLILPEEGDFKVDIDAGVGSIDLTVPSSLEARIEYDGGLSSLDTSHRFSKKGDGIWQTDHYANATNRALIKVSAGIGEVNIRD
ncbi:MAG: hypothetical protein JXB07_02245 [Anaerolineae bacterium]|nr:hypothetical protein [Anaerolineae bacterium]